MLLADALLCQSEKNCLYARLLGTYRENMMRKQSVYFVSLIMSMAFLMGCVAKDIEFTEQQKRMQRCEQYIERQREECLQGMPVTIEDYKDDYRAYEKSRAREAEENKPIIIPKKEKTDSD